MHQAKRAVLWLLLVPAGMLACSKPAAKQETSMGGMQMAAAAPETATLAAKNNSGITGNATLAANGDSTTVTVNLSGGKAGTTYPTHIHVGSCSQPGDVLVPLTSVTVDAQGSGSSTTMVPSAKLQGQAALLVQSHQPNGTPAACGEVMKP
jgi:hypothetical protein